MMGTILGSKGPNRANPTPGTYSSTSSTKMKGLSQEALETPCFQVYCSFSPSAKTLENRPKTGFTGVMTPARHSPHEAPSRQTGAAGLVHLRRGGGPCDKPTAPGSLLDRGWRSVGRPPWRSATACGLIARPQGTLKHNQRLGATRTAIPSSATGSSVAGWPTSVRRPGPTRPSLRGRVGDARERHGPRCGLGPG